MLLVQSNESDPVRREVSFFLVGTDGIAPALAEAGGQPQVSVNGGGWTDAGISTLVAVGEGLYVATLAQDVVAAVGSVIRTRYKGANTAECPGDSVQVVERATSGGDGPHSVVLLVVDGVSLLPVVGASASVRDAASGILLARGVTDGDGLLPLGLDAMPVVVTVTRSGSYLGYTSTEVVQAGGTWESSGIGTLTVNLESVPGVSVPVESGQVQANLVIRSYDGSPLPGREVLVQLMDPETAADGWDRSRQRLTSGPDGVLRLRVKANARYRAKIPSSTPGSEDGDWVTFTTTGEGLYTVPQILSPLDD